MSRNIIQIVALIGLATFIVSCKPTDDEQVINQKVSVKKEYTGPGADSDPGIKVCSNGEHVFKELSTNKLYVVSEYVSPHNFYLNDEVTADEYCNTK